jgi:hypothetical protein
MKTIRVSVTAEHIAEAEGKPRPDWWQWPVKAALEGLIGEDADIDGDLPLGYFVTIGARDDNATLVVSLDANAEAFLEARYERDVPGEPFFFELQLPDWLRALVAP